GCSSKIPACFAPDRITGERSGSTAKTLKATATAKTTNSFPGVFEGAFRSKARGSTVLDHLAKRPQPFLERKRIPQSRASGRIVENAPNRSAHSRSNSGGVGVKRRLVVV